MIKGLHHFTDHFAGNSDDFVVIGGAAAHEIMGTAGLPFRATKDIDIVILGRPTTSFCQKLVAYIEAGQIEVRQSKEGIPAYYRFLKPKQSDFPVQLEIFSRRPDELVLRQDQHIIPLPESSIGAELSAILLEDDYFYLIKNTVQQIKGLPVASIEAVIALKSRAFNDLKDRRDHGDSTVSHDEIKKHRNDILRLSQALSEKAKIQLPSLPKTHMTRFLDDLAASDINELKKLLKQFGIIDSPQDWIEEMRHIFLDQSKSP